MLRHIRDHIGILQGLGFLVFGCGVLRFRIQFRDFLIVGCLVEEYIGIERNTWSLEFEAWPRVFLKMRDVRDPSAV